MDAQVTKLISSERKRQHDVLEMIPSENYTSQAVRDAVGSVFINKYAEGYPGKRFYQGNSVVDELEALCIKRAHEAFHTKPNQWSINVQALSGSPANLAVYNALIPLGAKIMSMYLPDGGHLSHGWQVGERKVTLVSKCWDVSFYHVDPTTKVFDYKSIVTRVAEVKPKLLISGGTAYPREIDHQKMAEIAHSVDALYMADIAHEAGLVAAGVNSSPFPYADIVTMTTHKTLRGPRGAIIFTRRKPIVTWISDDPADLIDKSVFPGIQGGPHMHTIAGIAVALSETQTPAFRKYGKQVVKNAQTLAARLSSYGYDVVSGGTDKHLVLLDLRSKKIDAWLAAWALEFAGIIVNRNTAPGETGSSYYPSGLRLGTPAITTRGMKEREMEKIAGWIHEVLSQISNNSAFSISRNTSELRKYLQTNHCFCKVKEEIHQVVASFPI